MNEKLKGKSFEEIKDYYFWKGFGAAALIIISLLTITAIIQQWIM